MTQPETFFDWTTIPFSISELAARRQKLIQQIAAQGGGVFLAPSQHHFSDGFTFRQLDGFFYFTGLELPDSVLAIDADRGETTLFIPAEDRRFLSPGRPNDFPGRPLLSDRLISEKSGIIDIFEISALPAYLAALASRGKMAWLNPGRADEIAPVQSDYVRQWSIFDSFLFHLQKEHPTLKLQSAFKEIARQRMIKSPAELDMMRQACDITIDSIRETAAHIRPGIHERELEGILEAGFKKRGAQRLPFASIIKSGPNTLWPWRILASHYNRRDRAAQEGELVVFDVGCELNHYGSDMGRTFPASGRFTAEQADILMVQLEVLDAMIDHMRPGVTLSEVQQKGLDMMPEAAKPYMQIGHFFGHHIGLSPGDPSLPYEPLEAGMVITVEPWYYNHERQIGTFIEDVIVITETGFKNLTARLPRTAAGMAGMVSG
ncbi:MAG: Xaa-Pro peptidase family protein [Chloroflexota bacterium]